MQVNTATSVFKSSMISLYEQFFGNVLFHSNTDSQRNALLPEKLSLFPGSFCGIDAKLLFIITQEEINKLASTAAQEMVVWKNQELPHSL